MTKNSLIKLFSAFLVFTVFAVQAIAANVSNKLSEIKITKGDDFTYNLNLVFNDNFSGRAFMQTKDKGKFVVFIPDAEKTKNKIKITNLARKMPKVQITVDERPYVKDNTETSYLKLTVTTDSYYGIKLVSQKAPVKKPFEDAIKYVLYALFTTLAIAAILSHSFFNKKKKTNSYTVFPSEFRTEQTEKKSPEIQQKQRVTTPTDLKRPLKAAKEENFSCFDITGRENTRNKKNFEIQSSIQKTSVLTNDLKKSSFQTNPLKQTAMEDSSEFDLPFVQETEKTEIIIPEEKQEVSYLSTLNLTPTKGFYLQEINEEFCLFGFTGAKTILLQKFKDLKQINLQARFYDQDSRSDIYIVKLDSYKAMIEISEAGMKELAVL